jgi:prevent-host-death family protein
VAAKEEEPDGVFGDVEEGCSDSAGGGDDADRGEPPQPVSRGEVAHRNARECEKRPVGGHEGEVDPEREPGQIFAVPAPFGLNLLDPFEAPGELKPDDPGSAGPLQPLVDPDKNQIENDRRPAEEDQNFGTPRQGGETIARIAYRGMASSTYPRSWENVAAKLDLMTLHGDAAEVGIRELHDRLSEYLEKVEQGTEVLVTRRGKPVARLSHIEGPRPFEELERRGLVRWPTKPRKRRKPLVGAKARVSDLVEDQRR